MSGTIGGAWRNFQDGAEVEVAGQQPADTGEYVAVMPEGPTHDERGLLNTAVALRVEDVAATLDWLEPREIAPQDPPLEEIPVEYAEGEEPAVYGDQDDSEREVAEPEEPEVNQAADLDEGEDADPDHVPDRPGEYCLPSVPGFDWNALPDFEMPIVGQYLEVFYKHQLPQGVVSDLLTLFAQNRINAQAIIGKMDHAHTDEIQAELMAEWGADFRPLLDAVKAHLKDETLFPEGSGDLIAAARLPDGSRLVNHAHIMRYLARVAARSDRYIAEETEDESAEVASLNQLMATDIGEFQQVRQFGPNRDQTGSERLYALMKKREQPAAA
jgi:hypothetical protein